MLYQARETQWTNALKTQVSQLGEDSDKFYFYFKKMCLPAPGLSCSMWNLPGPEIELMSPALQGGFFTTDPPGLYLHSFFFNKSRLSAFFETFVSEETMAPNPKSQIFFYSFS